MKKLLLVGAVALFGMANAQMEKGTTYISGQVGFQGGKSEFSSKFGKEETGKNNQFSIVPTVGYFVANNVAVGLGIGYQSATSEPGALFGDSFDKTTISSFVVEPFARKYWNVGEKFFIFGQLSVPMEFGTLKGQENGHADAKATANSFGVVVKPGIDYVIAPNWTLEASLGEFGYRTSTIKPKDNPNDAKIKTDNYGFGLNFGSINFGVKYLFK